MDKQFESIVSDLREEFEVASHLLTRYKTLNNNKVELLFGGLSSFDVSFIELKIQSNNLLDQMLYQLKKLIEIIDVMHNLYESLSSDDQKQYEFIYKKRLEEYREYCSCICF